MVVSGLTPDVQSKPESAPASTSHHAAPVSIEDSGIELSGIDDNGVSASQIDDNGIELSGIELNGIEESGIELSGIDDNGVPFTPIELSGIELSGIELSGAALGAIELSGIELNGIDDNGIELSGIDDNGIDDNGAPVTSIELNGIELSGIELNGIELSGLALRSIELNGIELSGIELNGIELSGIELNGIDDNGTPRSVTSINVSCSRSAGVQPGMIVAMIWHQSRPIDDKGIDESGVEPKAIDDNGIDDRGVPSTSIDDNGACRDAARRGLRVEGVADAEHLPEGEAAQRLAGQVCPLRIAIAVRQGCRHVLPECDDFAPTAIDVDVDQRNRRQWNGIQHDRRQRCGPDRDAGDAGVLYSDFGDRRRCDARGATTTCGDLRAVE